MSMRSTALASLLGCVLLPACADQQESLIVLRAPAWESTDCLVDGGSDVGLLYGVLDVREGTPYLMPAALFNNLQEQSSESSNAGIITNEIQITHVDVQLESAQTPDLIDALEDMDDNLVSFDVPLASNSILPGQIEGIAVEVITRATSVAMRDLILQLHGPDAEVTVVASVVFHGLRSGNKVGNIGVIDAREFSFPVQICQGCLMDCSGCTDPTVCPPAGYMPGDFQGGICGNAQDTAIAPPTCELAEP